MGRAAVFRALPPPTEPVRRFSSPLPKQTRHLSTHSKPCRSTRATSSAGVPVDHTLGETRISVWVPLPASPDYSQTLGTRLQLVGMTQFTFTPPNGTMRTRFRLSAGLAQRETADTCFVFPNGGQARPLTVNNPDPFHVGASSRASGAAPGRATIPNHARPFAGLVYNRGRLS